MRYKTRPHNFPLDVFKVKTKYKTPKTRKKKSGSAKPPKPTFAGLAKIIQAKNKFLAKLPFVVYKIYNLGEPGSGFKVKGEIQDFYKIRDECLRKRILWKDPQFPANNKSIFHSKQSDKNFDWQRPTEIVSNPRFVVDGYSRFDVRQGDLGDCWFLAAVANLTLYRKMFFQVVPDDQSFTNKYAGVFHFRFWQYGRWIDVVIDDRLPTFHLGGLVFLHSTEENEFWSALLEKAYAKLHGSYEALKGGSTCEAMEDFTGGVTEMYELNDCPPNLVKILLKAYERSSLMGCSLEPDPNVLEAETAEGLIRGHAYSITCVKFVEIGTAKTKGKIPLLRLRNPWGNEVEWKGAWSDKSPEWRLIPERKKKEMGLTFEADGEFWMSYKDFRTYFERLEICNLGPDSLSKDELLQGHKKRWEMSVFEGEWVRGVTAGGCRNFLDTFAYNPQYRIILTDPDEEDDDDRCTVIIALMQKNRRHKRKMGMECLSIGFAVYHLPYPNRLPKPLNKNYFKYNACIARSPSYVNLREVSYRFKLSPGTYCIVPTAFDPSDEGEFLLRVFSEAPNNMQENDNEVGIVKVDAKPKDDTPPPEEQRETDKTREFFLKLAGEDMEVDWMELKEILDYAMRAEIKEGFSKDICRSMVAMMDADFSGKLGFEEFKLLWINIKNWKTIFKQFDENGTNQLSAFELRKALNSAGYRLNNHILNVLVHRYGTKDGVINFDDFIMCAVRLKTMFDIFRDKDPDNTDRATFSLEEWLQKTVYS